MKRLFALLLLAGLPAIADTQFQIFNTGVDNAGVLLPGGTPDPHYSLVSPAGTAWVITAGWPIGSPWASNTGVSQWIGPSADTGAALPVDGNQNCAILNTTYQGCDYVYQTTFDLTGFYFNTAILVGKWSTDNAGVSILLNGNPTGNSIPNPASFQLTPFTITSGFQAGINTLQFVVDNAFDGEGSKNPSGLQVEFTQSTAATPEPASILLLGTMLVGAASLLRKRLA